MVAHVKILEFIYMFAMFKERHWVMLEESTGKQIPYKSETLTYEDLLELDLRHIRKKWKKSEILPRSNSE